MNVRRILGSLLIALGVAGGLAVSSPAQAAVAAPDLDVTRCSIEDDPIDYGDGIDWYILRVQYTNEGNATAPGFHYRVRPVWDPAQGNEAFVERYQPAMAPGATVDQFYWVTKKVVDQTTWGIFLDVYHVVPDSQVNDNFCSFYVNNS